MVGPWPPAPWRGPPAAAPSPPSPPTRKSDDENHSGFK
jgi:hypothetical protein